MQSADSPSKEIFSYHLVKLPLGDVPSAFLSLARTKHIPGLNHSEHFFTMGLGEPILLGPRFSPKSMAFFAWWREEQFLDAFLSNPHYDFLNLGWHVRLKLYRRWGEVSEIKNAVLHPKAHVAGERVVGITLARLKLPQTLRFIKWGRPVERQVRDHKGQTLALAAFRPFNTFSTFSVWKNESEMVNMVHRADHKSAMEERVRKDFHHEFTTMRFVPTKEVGEWS